MDWRFQCMSHWLMTFEGRLAQNPLSKKSKNIEKWRIFICYPLSKKLKIIQKWRFFICYPYQYAAPYQKRKKESSKKWRIFICYPPSKNPKMINFFGARQKWNLKFRIIFRSDRKELKIFQNEDFLHDTTYRKNSIIL